MENQSIMTTREVANHLKLNEKTVIKMAQSGSLPGVKIGNQWRFHGAVIDTFLQQSTGQLSRHTDLLVKKVEITPLSRLTAEEFIELNVAATDVGAVLRRIAAIAAAGGVVTQEKAFWEELQRREQMLSTAIGNGVALPHARHPSAQLCREPAVIILRTVANIDYDAPDDRPVRLMFGICAPEEFIHLRLLAKVSSLFQDAWVKDDLLRAAAPADVLRILMEQERRAGFEEKVR